jgi:transposase
MMGERAVMQEALFYEFSLERHVPDDHLLRRIDRFVDLSDLREHLRPYYSETGRPSIDPELMIRMLLIGYCLGIRSERRLCEEVHLNLAYRWFCRLGSTARCRIIRRSRRTGTAASATAICCGGCSRRASSAAWRRGWSAARASRSMRA